jgi:hypothetical protein
MAPAAKKTRRGPSVALPGEGVWQNAEGDGARCPSTARHAAFNDQKIAESISEPGKPAMG